MSLSAPAMPEAAPIAMLRYFDVVVLVVAAPVLLLIGVPALGYAVGAGSWIALRALGVGVDRLSSAASPTSRELSLKLAYMLSRLFLLALAVIFVRNQAGQDAAEDAGIDFGIRQELVTAGGKTAIHRQLLPRVSFSGRAL